jgi:hypothetical protein
MLADESGFIISSELVLVATLLVIGLIVGMSEVQHAVVAELNDVADAIGSANQSYSYSGFTKRDGWGGWGWCGVHAYTAGSVFVDLQDECDMNQCMLACNPPVVEAPKTGAYGGGSYGYSYGGAYATGGASTAVVTPAVPVPTVAAPAAVPCPGGCDEKPVEAVPCPGDCDDQPAEQPTDAQQPAEAL